MMDVHDVPSVLSSVLVAASTITMITLQQVSRVYVGSFHDKPIAREEHSVLFAKDREVLLGRLRDLPKVRM